MAHQKKWIWIILLAYIAGFVLFPPRVLLINDEERYVVQAVAFSRGASTLPGANDESGTRRALASDYPPGTSALQVPFVMIGGWRAAAGLSVVCLVLLTVCTRRLLNAYALADNFALVVPAFVGSLFFGRVAMSDVPAAALVALALLLLRYAESRSAQWAFGAGFASTLCLLFREPVLILLAPFIISVGLRRREVAVALVAGAALGIAARMGIAYVMFGNAFYIRDTGYGFSLQSMISNLPQYAMILLVMFPLGAVLPFAYRGPNRPEMIIAFALYAILFLSFDYNAWRDNGVTKGTLLSARYMIPALPLLAVMAADVCPRLYHRLSGVVQRAVARGLPATSAALAVLAFAIHPLVRRLEAQPHSITRAIQEHTSSGIPVVINEKVAGKYASPVYGSRLQLPRSTIQPADLPRYCREYGKLDLVFLDRTDTELFKRDAEQNAAFLREAEKHLTLRLTYTGQQGPGLYLRVWQTETCQR